MTTVSCSSPASTITDHTESVTGNYFIAAYPPFSAWRKDQVNAVHEWLACPPRPGGDRSFGLYLHIPFCAHRCRYCYFLAYAGKSQAQMEQYLDALIRELALYRDTPAFDGRKVGCVYFGGGTPSLLSLNSLRRLLNAVNDIFPWSGAAEEVTFECAPQNVTPDKLRVLRTVGVNRMSLGIQQLDDEVLCLNGRIHRVADVERAWAMLRGVGFEEVNVDLIAGLVGETETSFRHSLDRVIGMDPDSVTIYPLEVPLNTPLYQSLQEGDVFKALPTWATKHARLGYAFDRLENAGYVLRSAYAAARNTAHRQFVYQEDQYQGADLLGVGVASFSYLGNIHFQNLASLDKYLASLDAGRLPIDRAYPLTDNERLVREFVLQLKLGRVETDRFRVKFGVEIDQWFEEPLRDFADRGWLTWDRNGIALTRDGLVRVDHLLPAFYLPKHQHLRYS